MAQDRIKWWTSGVSKLCQNRHSRARRSHFHSLITGANIWRVLVTYWSSYSFIASPLQQVEFRLLLILLLLQRCSPPWALASSVLSLQTSLSSDDIQFLHFNMLLTSMSTAFISHLLGLETSFFPSVYTSVLSGVPFRPSSLQEVEFSVTSVSHHRYHAHRCY